MGQEWIVVLNGFKVVKEALVNQGDSVVDRPVQPLQIDIGNGESEQGEKHRHWEEGKVDLCHMHFTDGKPAFKWTMDKNPYFKNSQWAGCSHSFCENVIFLPLLSIRCDFNKRASLEAAETVRSVDPQVFWIREEVTGTGHARWISNLRQRNQEIWW